MRMVQFLLVPMLRSPNASSPVELVTMLHRRIRLPGKHPSGTSSSISVMVCVCACVEVAEMCCSFDGLANVVRGQLGGNPLSGDGYVFVNRRRTMLRVLYFEPGGYCLWSKRLEQGRFALPATADQPVRSLSLTLFDSLLEGLDITVTKQRKRWRSDVHQGGRVLLE